MQPFAVVLYESILRNFTHFTSKYLCWTLFSDKVASSRPVTWQITTLIKIFSSEVREIFRNSFFIEHLLTTIPEPLQVFLILWKPCSLNFDSVNKKFLLNWINVITGYYNCPTPTPLPFYTASIHRPLAPTFC